MVGKDIDPSDIGKYPKIIKAAQMDMSQTDVLVCGMCHNVFHFIELFKKHKDEGCEKESSLHDCRESKPKVWAFLLWKTSQLSNNVSSSVNSWKLYQTWVKMDESLRATWVVAGKTIQSFANLGQGSLHEMPVKITKTVIDNSPKATSTPNRTPIKINETRPGILKKDETDEDHPPPLVPLKSEPVKLIRKTVGNPVSQPTVKQTLGTSVPLSKTIIFRANRTIPNTSGQEFEEQTVEKIIAKRFNPRRKIVEYLVKWEGFPHEQNTWEPQSHMERCPQLLDNFEKQLARQKQQRAAQVAKQATLTSPPQQQSQQQAILKHTPSTNNSTLLSINQSGRPARNSKVRALDQVKQWCADEEINSNSGGTKRKHDDSDFEEVQAAGAEEDEDFEDDVIPVHAVKRLKNGNAITVKVDSKKDVKITPVQPQTIVIKAVNGAIRSTTVETPAEVVITKDNHNTGIVKKVGTITTASTSSHKTEAQIRVLSKGENTTSGIVRITSGSQSTAPAVGVQKITTLPSATTTPPSATTTTPSTQSQRSSSNAPATVTSINPTGKAQVSQVQTHKIIINPKEKGSTIQQQQHHQKILSAKNSNPTSVTSGPRAIQSQPKTAIIQRSSLSPSVNQQNYVPTSGKMIINRTVKSAPTSKNVTPEQKIIQLLKSGDLKVTRKVVSQSPQTPNQQQQHQAQQKQSQQKQSQQKQSQQKQSQQKQSQQLHQKQLTSSVKSGEQLQMAMQEDPYPEPPSPPRPMTLCPVTGKLLSQPEEESVALNQAGGVKKSSESTTTTRTTAAPRTTAASTTTVASTKSAASSKTAAPTTTATPTPATTAKLTTSASTSKTVATSTTATATLTTTTTQSTPQSGVFHTQPPIVVAVEQQQANEEIAAGLELATEDGQQQILTSEDGTPLLVTGEDGTIYQVAGKNAEGQTILIAQGEDGEQQFAYVAAEDTEEGSVLALDNAVAEAVAQMLPEQQSSGGEAQFIINQDESGNATIVAAAAGENNDVDGTQTLTIQTGDNDSQDANIPAEVVQADLPSPGGTRRVVLLLQDGTFMMTEMHDDEYQALYL